MINEKLTKIQTTMYQDASTTTLNDFINHSIQNFDVRTTLCYQIAQADKVCSEFKDSNEEAKFLSARTNIKNNLYSTKFYDSWLFDTNNVCTNGLKLRTYNFYINPKNINFIHNINDFKDRIKNCFETERSITRCQNPDTLINIIDIPNWQDLFGIGEFPYMTIYVFRLGNTEYFAYTIGR